MIFYSEASSEMHVNKQKGHACDEKNPRIILEKLLPYSEGALL